MAILEGFPKDPKALGIPSGKTSQFASENGYLELIYPLKNVICP